LRRPLTRSSIKPRLLFPSAEQIQERSQLTEDEEEAVTDIESEDYDMSTPLAQVDVTVGTPKAPKFAPATPPTTVRATRSKDARMTRSPAGPGSDDGVRGNSLSPFDRWQRTKQPPASKKRAGSPTISKGRGGKKVRA